jgi:polysaccharide export outer membrane protein
MEDSAKSRPLENREAVLLARAISTMMLLLAGCAGAPPVTAVAEAVYVYRLGPGDRLKINTYGEDRLSGDFAVNGAGVIAFPLIGDVPASGQTVEQFKTDLVHRLGSQYLRHPNLIVEVENFRPVYILGEVAKPGQFPFAEGMTVFGLVAQAGGFTYRANRGRAMIRHENDAAESTYALTSGAKVRPGDTIRIPQRFF